MTISRHLAIIAASLVLAATACTSQAEDKTTPPQRLMTISGHGEVRHAPDMSTISAGVRTQGNTAQDALRANTAAMEGVFAAMRKIGIADKDMQTSNFSVQPVYQQLPPDRIQNEPAKIIGYQVFNQVTVIIRELPKLGSALDAFVTAGANEMYGVNFGIAETDALMDDARTAAVKDAMRKAQLMTKAAGVRLGRLMSISESSNGPPVPMYAARAEMAQSKSVPVATGEQVLSADASLTYELE